MFNNNKVKQKLFFVPWFNLTSIKYCYKKCISNRRYGFVGKELTKALINVGYTVSILSRTKIKIRQAFLLHVGYRKQTIEKEAVLNADYIIHLGS
jgi:hypothetical protein